MAVLVISKKNTLLATDFPASACLIYSEKGGGSVEGIKKSLQVII